MTRVGPLLPLAFVLASCGTTSQPAPPTTAPSALTPGHCTLDPTGGTALTSDRAPRGIAVGATGAIVLHTTPIWSRTGSSPGIVDLAPDGALAVSRDGQTHALVTPVDAQGYGSPTQELALFDADGEPALLDCERLGSADAACIARAPWSPRIDGLHFSPPVEITGRAMMAAGTYAGPLFVVALDPDAAESRATAWVITRDGVTTSSLWATLAPFAEHRAELLASERVTIQVAPDARARVRWISGRGGTELTLDVDARVVEPARDVAVDDPVERFFQLASTEAWSRAHEPTDAPMSAAAAAYGDRWIAVWATGTADAWQTPGGTTIRVAFFDPAVPTLPARIVTTHGSIQVSAGSSATRTMVAWEQHDAPRAGTELRLAALHCTPP